MFYVINIQTTKDDQNLQSIFAYATEQEAISAYHASLASNYASTTLSSFTVILIDKYGDQKSNEYWDESYFAEQNEP